MRVELPQRVSSGLSTDDNSEDGLLRPHLQFSIGATDELWIVNCRYRSNRQQLIDVLTTDCRYHLRLGPLGSSWTHQKTNDEHATNQVIHSSPPFLCE